MRKLKLFLWLLKNIKNMDELELDTDANGVAYLKTRYAQDKVTLKFICYKEICVSDGKEINS